MTEIPEHLLRRSRERRAALGGGGGDEAGGSDAGAGAEAPEARPARAATGAVEAAGSAAVTPIVDEQAAVEPPTYVAPARGPHKSKIPMWVMPVLVAIPLWAFLFPAAFGKHQKATSTDPLVIGNTVYHSAGCSGCHGANGEGGVGPALHGGQSVLTFPNIADQISWVKTGSAPFAGKKYGDPNRPGGQRGPATGGMPAFASSLSESQIEAVVTYERTKL